MAPWALILQACLTKIVPDKFIEYKLSDGRAVSVDFINLGHTTKVLQTFEPEENSQVEQQRQGWQDLLNNFKQYVEHKKN